MRCWTQQDSAAICALIVEVAAGKIVYWREYFDPAQTQPL
jgi:limonene-1,2-epoxide hydrolase